MDNHHFDFIVCGAGAAGRSFVCQLLQSSLHNARVLLLEQEEKTADDRTWSFWEDYPGPFEEAVCKRWDKLWFYQGDYAERFDLAPFSYKMVLASDYYRLSDERFAQSPQITRLQTTVTGFVDHPDGVEVQTTQGNFFAKWCIDSTARPAIDKSKYYYFDQHFRGWFIKTKDAVFHPDEAVLMDFRTPQHGEIRFLYVLPTSSHEALVEVAIFSNNHLDAAGYDQIIGDYLQTHWPRISPFEIVRTEQGVIPMTDFPFQRHQGHRVFLGACGGDTRASTGYTFLYIHRRVRQMIAHLEKSGTPFAPTTFQQRRHAWYDSLMLEVLQKDHYPGDAFFGQLFRRNTIQRLLRFLNGESTLPEELHMMKATPVWHFLKAIARRIVASFKIRYGKYRD